MNRKDRRRLQKTGGGKLPVRPAVRRPASVSDMLLGLGGVAAKPVAVPVDVAAPADPVHSALAQLRLNEGLAAELAKREQALREHPDSESLLHNVAKLQLRLDRRADALVTFRRLLALKPDHAEAAHMVGVLSGAAPAMPDAAYVANLFDAFADSFDEKLTQWLDYKAPAAVAGLARQTLGAGRKAQRAIDLGCGTGLLGPEIRSDVVRLDGVDLSPRMVEKARQRGCYDDLQVGEIVAFLNGREGAYDLALAADVLSYFGDLKPFLTALRTALRPDGVFVGTVEKGAGGRYQATKTGRYQHGEAYLRKRAAEAGFDLLELSEIVLRQEENRPVEGFVFALRHDRVLAAAATASEMPLQDLLGELDAPGADLVLAAARQAISGDFAVAWGIDIGGCMGRHATELRRLTQHLDMLTPDPVRCRRAFEAGIYDECDSDAVVPFLEGRPDHYDLIMAADLRPGEIDLPAFFSAVKIALALAGVFIAVVPTASLDPEQLRDMAKAEGLVVLAVEPVTLPGGPGVCIVAES
ncbi:MAG TPA: methyltransferase [Ferrovibrio sp.]|jgi:predicted TPR repeat methyltransferase|uniref:methyltransferase n=1 Tax=Ferrovibrio sp. TaxID=1917215 RepID=UPI002B4B3A1F|nr:methyltransferase [Ferrovibrio sp.]HLT78960.1 methyltransferase [Ferrovibrio sp.]